VGEESPFDGAGLVLRRGIPRPPTAPPSSNDTPWENLRCVILSLPEAPALLNALALKHARRRRTAKDLTLPRTWHVLRRLRSFAVLRRHVSRRERTSTNGGSGSLRMTHQLPPRSWRGTTVPGAPLRWTTRNDCTRHLLHHRRLGAVNPLGMTAVSFEGEARRGMTDKTE
jgi:hypothetical protein